MKGQPYIILYVEDNMDHAELVLLSLERQGLANHHIHHVTNGEAALDYLYQLRLIKILK